MSGFLNRTENRICFQLIVRTSAILLALNLLFLTSANNARAEPIAVFLVARSADGIAQSLRKQSEAAAPKAIAQLRGLATSAIKGNEREYTVVFYANRKLPIGTQIRIEHQFTRPGMGKLQPYVMKYAINAGNQSKPFVILNKSQAGGSGGSIAYRIYLNGKLSGSTTVQIR